MLPTPQIVEFTDGRVEVQIPEVYFPYDHAEYQRWRYDPLVRYDLLKGIDLGVGTVLNKNREAFDNQPECHYCEMKVAQQLVMSGYFSPPDLLYENWRLSSSSPAFSGNGKYTRFGAESVRSNLGAAFLDEMSNLIDANDELIQSVCNQEGRLPSGKNKLHDSHIDLFGYSQASKRCAILEVKRDTDPIRPHQNFLLAFAAYLFVVRGSGLGLDPELTLNLGFVRFQSQLIKPTFVPVAFRSS